MSKLSSFKIKSQKIIVNLKIKSSKQLASKIILVNHPLYFESERKYLNLEVNLMELFLNFQRVPKVGVAIKKVTLRTLKLLFWGIILQGMNYKNCNFLFDQTNFDNFKDNFFKKKIAKFYMYICKERV